MQDMFTEDNLLHKRSVTIMRAKSGRHSSVSVVTEVDGINRNTFAMIFSGLKIVKFLYSTIAIAMLRCLLLDSL